MPIVNDGMTREEAEKLQNFSPKGKYGRPKVFADETGEVVFESDKGNKMLRFGLKVSSGPYKDGVTWIRKA